MHSVYTCKNEFKKRKLWRFDWQVEPLRPTKQSPATTAPLAVIGFNIPQRCTVRQNSTRGVRKQQNCNSLDTYTVRHLLLARCDRFIIYAVLFAIS